MTTEAIESVLAIANKLGGASFATLLVLILWGSFKNIWIWGRDADKITARYEVLLAKEQQEKEWWRTLAMRATGIAEGTISALAKKTEA